ncbi:hypothetical protein RJ640_024649 [Escallonia rubra]|uniref:RNase H type-1 domain-containing protein n=1 Tax=Escallonia rubra TaxID=112253 RepID=A0AA88UM82_9ASTE|nr:hypothetical protein RJ640_024649 [Escallonia rubra]
MALAQEYLFFINRIHNTPPYSSIRHVKWSPPLECWVKINTDGSVNKHEGQAGATVIIRDSSSQWIIGCSKRLHIQNSHNAGWWAIRDGLCLAWQNNHRKIILEVDDISVVHYRGGSGRNSRLATVDAIASAWSPRAVAVRRAPSGFYIFAINQRKVVATYGSESSKKSAEHWGMVKLFHQYEDIKHI